MRMLLFIFRKLWVLVTVLLCNGDLEALSFFHPQKPNPFHEEWRWTELEYVAAHRLYDMDEDAQGRLWLLSENELMVHDGMEMVTHAFASAGIEKGSLRTFFVAGDSSIYAAGSQVVRFSKGGGFEKLGAIPAFTQGRNRMDQSEDGSVWVASSAGIYRIHEGRLEAVDLGLDACSSLLVDEANRLWVAEGATGLIYRYDLNTEGGLPDGNPAVIQTTGVPLQGGLQIEFFKGHSDGVFWIASRSKTEPIRRVEGDQISIVVGNLLAMGVDPVRDLVEDSDGRLWVASRRVLTCYEGGQWKRLLSNENRTPSTLPILYYTADDRLVIGGELDPLYMIDCSERNWTSYKGLIFQCESAEGFEWFLSEAKEVVRHDRKNGEWVVFEAQDGAIIDSPNSIFASTDGCIWISGSHGGNAAVSLYQDGEWRRDVHDSVGSDFGHLSPLEDASGNVYFGSITFAADLGNRTGGVVRYDAVPKRMRYTNLLPPDFPARVARMQQTPDGSIWFGGAALSRYNAFGITNAPIEEIPLFHDTWTDDLVVSEEGSLWVAAWGLGVFQYSEGNWKRHEVIEPTRSRQYVTMLAGRKNPGIWLATGGGVFRYDGVTWSRFHFMNEVRFKRESATMIETASGRVWLNQAPRSWFFNEPSDATDLRPLSTVGYLPDTNPPDTQIIVSEDRVFESQNLYIRWKGTDFRNVTGSREIEYSYRVDDGSWSEYSTENSLLMENVAPGQHRIEVRARDADWNVDPTPAVLLVHVVPYLWKRPVFIIPVLLTFCLIVALITFIVRYKYAEILRMEQFKLQFFTNLSHELKTPLSVIVGPLQSLANRQLEHDVRDMVTIALRNANKLQRFVEQLLEFRKTQTGHLEFRPRRSDVVFFIKQAIYSNEPLWKERNQQFSFHINEEELTVAFDAEMLEHILDNLISNACKFTPEGGCIDIAVEIGQRSEAGSRLLRIDVTDTGKGIAKEQQIHLFQPFCRHVDEDETVRGTGIGLAYTYDVVEIWGGRISFQSPVRADDPEHPGSRFSVELPLSDFEVPDQAEQDFHYGEEENPVQEEDSDLEARGEQPVILIVDDDPDIRLFLSKELSGRYGILHAGNGKDGLELAVKEVPDLILTDVMMPEMDGFEFCKLIRSRDETSHIPVIMLTARRAEEFRSKGIQCGVDDFFRKPLNLTLLDHRILQLMESRKLLKERFSRHMTLDPSDVQVTPVDEIFLKRAIKIVEQHMMDEDYNVSKFAVDIGMSRVSLYRKIKALTGHPPYHFIRSLRLKRAAQLLGTGEVTVGEVLVQVGILEMSYFSKVFRKEYGVAPSDYRKRAIAARSEASNMDEPYSKGERAE
jgi:signal transduction histidine kinase/CheY-like chemotaxis protein/ligand-binding sensor domain-containing protein